MGNWGLPPFSGDGNRTCRPVCWGAAEFKPHMSQLDPQPLNALMRSAPLERPKVLVVDDEQIILDYLKSILTKGGYEPILASSGAEALEILRQTRPDLVLLDVMMAPMDGFEVLRQIRLSYQDTELPVLMVTGDSDRASVIKAFREGANDYLNKPLDSELILSRILLQIRLCRSQADLAQSQERYRLAAEGARIGLWDWDVAEEQVFVSCRGKELLGYSDDELHYDLDTWTKRVHPNDVALFESLLTPRRPGDRERFDCEVRMLHRDLSYRWIQCSGVIQTDEHGVPRRLAGSLADVTEGKVRDVLTGLPNRLLFEERLERMEARLIDHIEHRPATALSSKPAASAFLGTRMVECGHCGSVLRVKQSGRHLCPSCQAEFVVDEKGHAKF